MGGVAAMLHLLALGSYKLGGRAESSWVWCSGGYIWGQEGEKKGGF